MAVPSDTLEGAGSTRSTVAAPAPAGSRAVVAAMARPAFYRGQAGRVVRVELRETHLSWVFLAGELAYKVKKPLRMPFVDFSTLARRREMCREEVRLNRRLAPDIYLGVRSIVPHGEGYALSSEDDPRAVEYAVEMRRFDESRTLAALLARGEATPADMDRIAGCLAAFHASVEHGAVWHEAGLTVKRRLDETFETLLAVGGRMLERGSLASLERWATACLAGRRDELERRARAGRMRHGHGDLRADHVLLGADGTVKVVDCVEFDRDLRFVDVGADVSFLVMELEANGASFLADRLLAAYREAGGDPGDDALIAFFVAERALVRAKVAFLRSDQLFTTDPERPALLAQGRALVALAERAAWRSRRLHVLAFCGVAASGKSVLARLLARETGLSVIGSDVTRKSLARLAPTARGDRGLYSAAQSRRTYDELGRRAAAAAAADGGVIVDATLRDREDRAAFRRGHGAATPVVFVECRAPAAVVERRARERLLDPRRESDATPAIARRQIVEFAPLDEVPAEAHIVLRTDRPPERVLEDLRSLLDARLVSAHRPSE